MDVQKSLSKREDPDPRICSYPRSISSSELIELAIQSGEYSRFALDPRIPKNKFEKLYTLWINRAVAGEIAEEVLVIKESGEIIGFVTLSGLAKRASIGLIAVDRAYRGSGYGGSLIKSAIWWCGSRNLRLIQVRTQDSNTAACRFYRKCGFDVEKTEYLYHVWL